MKKIVILLMSFLILSCSNSKENLTKNVKKDIDKEMSKKAKDSGVSFSITKFQLVHKSGNEYNGILETNEGGDSHKYEVVVTTDGDSFIWKILGESE